MVISPLVERDLRQALRKKWPHRLRFSAGLASCLWTYLAYSTSTVGAASSSTGRWVFLTTSTVILVLSSLVGPVLTSRALHNDRQTRMLDLLLITKTGSFGILLSRLLTHSNPIVQVLIGLLPVLSLPLALGGVSIFEVFRMACLSIATLLFSAVVGIFAATQFKSTRLAVTTTCFLLLAATLGSYQFDISLSQRSGLYYLPGIVQGFQICQTLKPALIPAELAATLGCLIVSTAGFWLLAGIRLPRTTQPTFSGRIAPKSALQSRQDRRHKGKRRSRNPIRRLVTRRQWKPTHTSTLLAGISMLGFWFILSEQNLRLGNNHLLLLLVPLSIHSIIKLMLLVKTTFLIADCRNSGELEILLATPVRPSQIYLGFRAAILQAFRGPLALVLSVDIATALLSSRYAISPNSDRIIWLVIWGLVVMLAIDLWTSTWVGLWEGIRSDHSNRALIRTLVRTFVIPSLAFVFTLSVSPLLHISAYAIGGDSIYVGAIIWFWIVGLTVKTPFAFHAQRALKLRFRSAVADDLKTGALRGRPRWFVRPS